MKHQPKPERRVGQHTDETAIDYLRRMINALAFESDNELDRLPTTEAVLEYFDLWTTYDTDFLDGIVTAIEAGASPEPYNSFVNKWELGWNVFTCGEWVSSDPGVIRIDPEAIEV